MVGIIKKNNSNSNRAYNTYIVCLIIILFNIFPYPIFSQIVHNADSVNNQLKEISKKDTIVTDQLITAIPDSTKNPNVKIKSARRATIYSMILPGLGQTYNGRYWKVPIIYSIFAGLYFMESENNYKYNQFKHQYAKTLAGEKPDAIYKGYTQESLLQRKDYYKRNRDFMVILGAIAYMLNILDANVDAHLMDYDINPDLTLKVSPEINNFYLSQNCYNKSSFGIKFALSLH